MPRRHTSCPARPAISPPSKRIEPALGGKVPAIRLKIVVLPEPFGPIRPRISPGLTAKDTPLTARNPPNRLARPATSSTGFEALQGLRAHRVWRGDRQRQRRLGAGDLQQPPPTHTLTLLLVRFAGRLGGALLREAPEVSML